MFFRYAGMTPRVSRRRLLFESNFAKDATFIEVYRPKSQQEVVLLKMVLERDDIAFYITNEGVNSLFHVQDVMLGDMRLMVERRSVDHCKVILREELELI